MPKLSWIQKYENWKNWEQKQTNKQTKRIDTSDLVTATVLNTKSLGSLEQNSRL